MQFRKLFDALKKEFSHIPTPIKKFGIKALLFFIAWQTLYLLFFLQNRTLDKPLSLLTGKTTVYILNAIKFSDSLSAKETSVYLNRDNQISNYEKTTIFLANKKLIGISDSCNGLSLFLLYVGFIVSYPSKLKSKVLFILIGSFIIFFANVMRCVLLSMIQFNSPKYLDFAHHYLFNVLIYSLVFYLWIIFSKKNTLIKKQND
jgi:exosortase family protein XrtF